MNKKQYAVIGLGRFGHWVARTLAEMGCEVMAMDRDEEKVKAVSEFISYAMVVDAMDEKALRAAGVHNIDIAIVSIGENIEANIIVVMLLKEIGIHNIIAKAVTPLHGKVLEHLDVNRIVYPERDMAIRIAHSLVRPRILEQLELSPEYSIIEMTAPSVLIGKSLQDSQLRKKYQVNLIAIKRDGDRPAGWNVNPLPTDVIRTGDILVLIGSNDALEKFGKLI
jgi:trk system potassium uptake protein TrkA